MLHLIPSIVAVCLFHSSVTFLSALVAFPMNLVWLYSAGKNQGNGWKWTLGFRGFKRSSFLFFSVLIWK
jgi:hypothetical protein